MKNGEMHVNELIEEYEERLYERYKLAKITDGLFAEKTVAYHDEWKQILKFVYENDVDSNFTYLQFKNAMDFLGAKMLYHDQDKDFNKYWSAVAKMYYYVHAKIERLVT